MPPAKERGKTDASSSKSSKSKGKQRAIDQDEDLDVDAFVRRQIKALNAPLNPLDRSTYYTEDADGKETDPPQQKTLDKAVKAVNSQLEAARRKKHGDASIRAIVEQIEYLKEEQAAEQDAEVLDDAGRLRVDGQDWLEDLPDEWPGDAENAMEEYRDLLEEVRKLQAEKEVLQQKEEHYAYLTKLMTDEIDVKKLATLLNGKPAPKKGVRKSSVR